MEAHGFWQFAARELDAGYITDIEGWALRADFFEPRIRPWLWVQLRSAAGAYWWEG
jgi:hypothetical protein